MCFLDSPIGRCEAVHEMVLLDETQAECAREHDCPPDRQCPLDGHFTTMSGVDEDHIEAVRARLRHDTPTAGMQQTASSQRAESPRQQVA